MQPRAPIVDPAARDQSGNPFQAPRDDDGERSAAEVEKDFMLLSSLSQLLVILSIGAFVWACVSPRASGFYESCAAAALAFLLVAHGVVDFARLWRARRSPLFVRGILFRAILLPLIAAMLHLLNVYAPRAGVAAFLMTSLLEFYLGFMAAVSLICLVLSRRDRASAAPLPSFDR